MKLSAENPLKDVYNPRLIGALGANLRAAWPAFDEAGFVRDACAGLEGLGFNERCEQITDALTTHLPEFARGVEVLLAALGERRGQDGTNWDGFITVPQNGWVARHGTGPADFDRGMEALRRLTPHFSAENHLRHFIDADPERALGTLERWLTDPDEHVRRLVSEGTRPRLPMTGRIRRFVEDPEPVIALVDRLKDDESEYVRRSVANNVNDIAKDHPERALELLERWSAVRTPERQWVVRHAARTLLKAGHPRALALLGFTADPELGVALSVATDPAPLGGQLEFTAAVTAEGAEVVSLLVDYVVHYVKANGRTRPKVFKWTKRTLTPGETVELTRRQHLRDTSGRTHHPGTHAVELQINGQRFGRASFEVVPADGAARARQKAEPTPSVKSGPAAKPLSS